MGVRLYFSGETPHPNAESVFAVVFLDLTIIVLLPD